MKQIKIVTQTKCKDLRKYGRRREELQPITTEGPFEK